MNLKQAPSEANQFHQAHVHLLLESYLRLLKRPLIDRSDTQELGRVVFNADFVLLSHNIDADPLFDYANRMALDLFEMSWNELIGMPSRLSAEPVNREERERLLSRVAADGYIDDYSGVRISKTGKRFLIRQAVVWNVYDEQGRYQGQAASFRDWTPLA